MSSLARQQILELTCYKDTLKVIDVCEYSDEIKHKHHWISSVLKEKKTKLSQKPVFVFLIWLKVIENFALFSKHNLGCVEYIIYQNFAFIHPNFYFALVSFPPSMEFANDA